MKAIKTEMGWVPPVNLKDMLASRRITEDNRDVTFEPFIIDEGVTPEMWDVFVSKQSKLGGKVRLYNYPVNLYSSITSQEVIGEPMLSQHHSALSRAIEAAIIKVVEDRAQTMTVIIWAAQMCHIYASNLMRGWRYSNFEKVMRIACIYAILQ
jgi:hypothetical protein